jgi:hypothetical protein
VLLLLWTGISALSSWNGSVSHRAPRNSNQHTPSGSNLTRFLAPEVVPRSAKHTTCQGCLITALISCAQACCYPFSSSHTALGLLPFQRAAPGSGPQRDSSLGTEITYLSSNMKESPSHSFQLKVAPSFHNSFSAPLTMDFGGWKTNFFTLNTIYVNKKNCVLHWENLFGNCGGEISSVYLDFWEISVCSGSCLAFLRVILPIFLPLNLLFSLPSSLHLSTIHSTIHPSMHPNDYSYKHFIKYC